MKLLFTFAKNNENFGRQLCIKIMHPLSGKVTMAILDESDDLRDTVRREPETCFLADEAKPTRSSIFQFTRNQQALVAKGAESRDF